MNIRSHSGFTLLELMIAITVLAILLGLAIPSFTGVIRQNRVATQSNELVAALALSRSEAVKRGTPVSVCAANAAQSACSGSNDWSLGWIVFSDATGTAGTIDGAADTIVLRSAAPSLQNVTVSNVDTAFVRYTARGAIELPVGTAQTQFTVVPASCSGTEARAIAVLRTGRVSKTTIACS
jgi:type IV fimbrial biogenesis protein FimT